MRLLRPAALALALVVPVLAPSPALAATVVTELPPGWITFAGACFGGDGGGGVTFEEGPGTPPLGSGSLEISTVAPEEQTIVGHDVNALAAVSSWQTGLRTEPGVQSIIAAQNPEHSLQASPVVAPGTWSTVDAFSLEFVVFDLSSSDQVMTGTLQEYKAAFPVAAAQPATLFLGNVSCFGDPGSVNIDAYSWTESGSFTEYDFEPASAPTTSTISSSAKTVTAGKDVTLRTTLKGAGKVLKGVPVELFGREAGEPDFTSVGVAMTNTDGVAKVIHSPQRNTTYQWRFAGGGGGAATESATRVVQVRSHVTLALADSSLRKGQKLVGTGKVTPAKVGEDATLWRVTKKGRTRLDRGAIGADGRYEVAAKVKQAGTWKVVVTVPAAGGNEAGTSPARKATVK